MEIKLVCEDCNKEMPVDESKSNDNWKAYKPECDECGGKGKFQL